MSPKQKALYFREWARVRSVDPSADRHALHTLALGTDKSSKEFTNADLDKVLGAFRAVTRPADLNAQVRQEKQPDIRQYHAIKLKLVLLGVLGAEKPAHYAAKACNGGKAIQWFIDLHHTSNPEQMYPAYGLDLDRVIWTLARCISRLRQVREWSEHELFSRAGALDHCRCARCAKAAKPTTNNPSPARTTKRAEAIAAGIDCPW